MKATWHQQILATSDHTVVVEGNHYFPTSALNKAFFKPLPSKPLARGKG